MITLNSKTLKKFLKKAGDELQGEWLLIGGTLLPVLGIDHRVTLDIDLLPLGAIDSNKTVLSLMELAEKLGLPVETINQAGLYFLQKIPDFEQKMLLLYQGKSARIFRPTLTLFLELKVKRLSESDLSDCLEYIHYSKKNGETEDPFLSKAISSIEQELKKASSDSDRLFRLAKLKKSLARLVPACT